jgi:hypothetical protein
MAKSRPDTSFRFGANLRPRKKKPKGKKTGASKRRGRGSFGS